MPRPSFKPHHRLAWLWLPIFAVSIFAFHQARLLGNNTTSATSASSSLETHLEYQPKLTKSTAPVEALNLSAHSAILVDQKTNEVLYAKNLHQAAPPASILKIVTALVTLQSGDQNRLLTVSQKDASVEPNIMALKAGEKVSVKDLLYGLFMISANDAAETLADNAYPKRGEFIGQMNKAAQRLGLKDSYFANPTGLDDGQTKSSVFDLATITHYTLEKHPLVRELWSTHNLTIPADQNHGPYYLYNISDLIDIYPGIDGVKTGYTDEAGHTLIATATRGNRSLLLVYMNAVTSIQDATALFDYGFAH